MALHSIALIPTMCINGRCLHVLTGPSSVAIRMCVVENLIQIETFEAVRHTLKSKEKVFVF